MEKPKKICVVCKIYLDEVLKDVYKCPKCKILNKFGDGTKCQNFFKENKICKFDIENAYDDEADQFELLELTEHEYKLKLAEWDIEFKEREDVQHWFC